MAVKRTHDKIENQFAGSAKMEATEVDLQALSRNLVKMAPHDKQDRASIESIMSCLFE